MLIKQALAAGQKQLIANEIPAPYLDSLLLLAHILSCSKEQILLQQNSPITDENLQQFLQIITRRCQGEPISHLLGKREFYGHDFVVNNDVLDPRCDSEILIELVLEFVDSNKKQQILDLGTGSGCLLLTLLKNLPNSDGLGVDLSVKALKIAQKNAHNLQLEDRVKFVQSSWFSALKSTKKFDIIISNPPYIKKADIANLSKDVKNFDPISALDGGISGLECYEEMARNIANFLNKDGIFCAEIGQGQEKDVKEIFEKNGLKFIKEKKDLAGIVRSLVFFF